MLEYESRFAGQDYGRHFLPGDCIIQENRQKGKEREKIMTESLQKAVLIYLFLINLTAFSIYGIDKYRAKHRQWRIPEATLLLSAALGGSVMIDTVDGKIVYNGRYPSSDQVIRLAGIDYDPYEFDVDNTEMEADDCDGCSGDCNGCF